MSDFENATRYAAQTLPSCDRDGRDLLLVVVAARFALPLPGGPPARLSATDVQPLPPLTDEYTGDPARSGLRREGQSAYTRPATDISILGHACAPEGKLVRQMGVNVRVGPCSMRLAVYGDRVWQRALVGVKPSAPEPFERLPLTWERAYGGVAAGSTPSKPAFEPRNPVGCGLETNANDAVDKRLPNVEDPAAPIASLSDRPRPVGLLPVARYWQPRVGFAGTYDDAWRRDRAPLWPTDFDERFFCAAPAELQARPHLRGGEPVVLDGLHPGGAIGFHLPVLRFVVRSRFIDRVVRKVPVLDALIIDTDAMQMTLCFRCAVSAPLSLIKHRETLLREVEPWETSDS
jgi:hypothetical protein